ncbi:hypothetical protein GDO78_011991 [Eleutherodactylus coqui]|uniref:Uncharacterized protein n=1 Tax=Eleutherodactylus coqui TaxID=57060 RepID=A0A8J6K483_ELECQ|nr:hypothetical protein GDO78_011991 [Eleutherodactylus coqui]
MVWDCMLEWIINHRRECPVIKMIMDYFPHRSFNFICYDCILYFKVRKSKCYCFQLAFWFLCLLQLESIICMCSLFLANSSVARS